ncbi:MAG: ABC transporter permease [Saprospiraceae bacterium]
MNALLSSFSDAWTSLRSNFLQTFLSMLGIIIGVGALVAMLSLIDGLEQLARDQISGKTSLENMSISANTHKRIDDIRVKKDTVAVFTQALMESLLTELPQEATGQLSVGGSALGSSRDTQQLGITYRAVTFPVIDKEFELAGGRWPDSAAATATSTTVVEALVNYKLALKLVAPDTVATAAIGSTFQLLGGTLKVVGVAEKSDKIGVNGTLFGYNQLPALPEATPGGGQLQLSFASVEDVLPAKEFIEPWIEEYFSGIEEPVRIETHTGYLEAMEEGFLVFRLVMGFLIGIAVVVGGVGIMNVLVMSVVERTSEIGIRKALGADRKSIIAQFLSEAVALSVIGSFFGTILGVCVALLGAPLVSMFSTEIEFSAIFTVNTLLIVGLVAIGIGCLFGTYPALRASNLDPVSAIRRL